MSKRTGKAAQEYRNALLLANENYKAIDLCQTRMDAERNSGEKFLIHNHAAMAEALLALGKLDGAIAQAEASIANAPTFAPDDNIFWWTNSIVGSAYARQGKWPEADKYLQLAVSILPKDQGLSVFKSFDWHRAHRIYRDLGHVHREWDNSTEREKWNAELAKFEEQRAKLDPLMRGGQQH
jgi:tetratricopeptide (TPR) repeat protein